MPIFLMRHGQTKLSGTFCGTLNPPLTRAGRAQAAAAARHLAPFLFDACYVSPLLRTQETARMLQRELKMPFVTRRSLRELHFGAWEGLRFNAIEKRWPMLAKHWADDPMSVRIPRAETFVSLRRRIRHFAHFIRNKNILVVAHGGSLAALALELLGLPDKEFPKNIQPLGSVRMIQGNKMRTIC